LACRPGGELARRARKEGISVWEVPMRGEWDALAAWRLGAMAADADLLHAHTSHTHSLALMAVRIGAIRPVLVHRRVDFPPGTGPFTRWKYRTPDMFIAISEAVEGVLESAGVPSSKIRVVHSGIDPDEVISAPSVDLRKELGCAPDAPLIGNIAQLVDHKGHQYLIDAVPELLHGLPKAHVVIVGSGPLEEELRSKITGMRLTDRVHMLGWRDDAVSILKAFDIFVMPSHLEGMGTSVLDAFAAKVPVVASDAGGIGEMVKDGLYGRLVPAKDPKALAKTIIEAVEDKTKSERMAENASKTLHERYTADCMVAGVSRVYEEMIK